MAAWSHRESTNFCISILLHRVAPTNWHLTPVPKHTGYLNHCSSQRFGFNLSGFLTFHLCQAVLKFLSFAQVCYHCHPIIHAISILIFSTDHHLKWRTTKSQDQYLFSLWRIVYLEKVSTKLIVRICTEIKWVGESCQRIAGLKVQMSLMSNSLNTVQATPTTPLS